MNAVHGHASIVARRVPQSSRHGHGWCSGLACGLTLALAGCGSADKLPAAASRVVTSQQPLEIYLQQADSAAKEGLTERARGLYRDAAKAYPASKEPWARLADDYFARGDYGNAILAAQEVTQRDARDSAAQGVLVVSGLRVSTQAMRDIGERQAIAAARRDEAQDLARNLRLSLGDTSPGPTSADAGSAPAPAAGARAKPPVPAPAPAATRASAATPTAAPRGTTTEPVKPVAATVRPAGTKPTPTKAPSATGATAAPSNPFKVLD